MSEDVLAIGEDKILDLQFLREFIDNFKSLDGKTPVVILSHKFIKSDEIDSQHVIYIVPELSDRGDSE